MNSTDTGKTYDELSKDLFYKYNLIRETISAMDVANVLGLDVNNKGRCRCPFHNGEDRNMRIYPGNRGFYCFVCHEHGDSISLARKLLSEDCKYYEAAKWIDNKFHLNIFENKKPSIRERMRRIRNTSVRAGGIKE